MNTIKRPIKCVMLYLVYGFVMTWLVAWALALVPRVYSFGFQDRDNVFLREDESPWGEQLIVINTRWVGAEEYQFISLGRMKAGSDNQFIMPTYSKHVWWVIEPKNSFIIIFYEWKTLKAEFSNDPLLITSSSYSILRYGFPYVSHEVRAMSELTNTPAGLTTTRTANGGFSRKAPTGATPFRGINAVPLAIYIYLPYHPIWYGLLYNTLFYAFIFLILGSIKRAFHHARRLRKGKCPICAYDLKFDNTLGCPECGWRKESGAQA